MPSNLIKICFKWHQSSDTLPDLLILKGAMLGKTPEYCAFY